MNLSDNIHIRSGQDASEAMPVPTIDGAGDGTFITGSLSTSRELMHWESSSEDDIIIMETKKCLEITMYFFPRVKHNLPQFSDLPSDTLMSLGEYFLPYHFNFVVHGTY